MTLLGWLLAPWRRRQRAIDIAILWPSVRDLALDLERARAAFLLHARQDQAWLELGETKMLSIIEGLR